jgi:translation initiation factor 3 subunit C
MIWNEELSASWDQSAAIVVFHQIELSLAQQLALTVTDKVSAIMDQSEKVWTTRGSTVSQKTVRMF